MKQLIDRLCAVVAVGAAAFFVTAYAQQPAPGAGGSAANGASRSACAGCGTVTAVHERNPVSATRIAAAPVATVAGAAARGAAAAARDHDQPQPRNAAAFEVVIEMDDGSERRMLYQNRPALDVGDKVRLRQGQIYLR